MTLKEYHQQVVSLTKQLLQDKVTQLPEQNSSLKQAVHYALLNGGKRTRPLLVYLTGNMLDCHQQELDAIAMALECIHCYSLIHDDLPAMDDDDLRRGQPTCHIKFDEATAILAGDALQSLAFELLVSHELTPGRESHRLSLVKHLSLAAGYRGMCGGQALDMAATNQPISQSELQDLHHRKTGALLKAAVIMPTLLKQDMSEHHKRLLALFADNIGLAFQVQDDILDVISDSQTLGKPQGSDQAHNKSTYPSLLGLDGARDYLQQLHQQALQALTALPYNTRLLVEFSDYIVKRSF